MKIVVHVGMHKTGSTAIQDFFFNHSLDGIGYAPWNGPNHCGLFILLFENEERLASYHGFKALGPGFLARLPEMRREWREKLTEYLTSFRGETVLLSAEDISWPGFNDATRSMIDFLRRFSDDVQGIGYAREARSFALSAFQQQLKGSEGYDLNLDGLWPSYKKRFEPLDNLFGEGNFELRPYDRSTLHNGSVVADIAKFMGRETLGTKDVDSNSSLTAEATALLYLQRTLGSGFGEPGPNAHTKNNKFVAQLSKIGKSKFDFDDATWSDVVERNAHDIDWLSQRLSIPLPEHNSKGRIKIRDGSDLISLAIDNVEELKKVISERVLEIDGSSADKAKRLVNLLRLLA